MNWKKKQQFAKSRKDGSKDTAANISVKKDAVDQSKDTSQIEHSNVSQTSFLRMNWFKGLKAPKMNDFTTSVFNKNSKVEDLISEIMPSDE